MQQATFIVLTTNSITQLADSSHRVLWPCTLECCSSFHGFSHFWQVPTPTYACIHTYKYNTHHQAKSRQDFGLDWLELTGIKKPIMYTSSEKRDKLTLCCFLFPSSLSLFSACTCCYHHDGKSFSRLTN